MTKIICILDSCKNNKSSVCTASTISLGWSGSTFEYNFNCMDYEDKEEQHEPV